MTDPRDVSHVVSHVVSMKRKLTAELMGTFSLVFAGTGAITVNDMTGGMVSHVGVALTFGLVVMAMIYAVGNVSGAHINPAVTLGFWAARRIPLREAAAYIAVQCAGALGASLTLRALFPAHAGLGGTIPSGSAMQSFALELVLTLILMFVILSVSTGSKERGIMAGAAVGAVVGLGALFAGPISGASMNPARSLGPAVVALRLDALWIYLTAPVIGALTAVPLCRQIHHGACCDDDPGGIRP